MTKKLIILGSATRGGALLIIDSIKRSSIMDYEIIGILDDTEGLDKFSVLGVKVIGGLDKLEYLYTNQFFDEAVIAVGSVKGRNEIFQRTENLNIKLANIIDDSVRIRTSVSLGYGNVIMPGCDFGPAVILGNNNFFCSHTIIEHESIVGNGCSFSAGCTFAGRVKIGNFVYCNTRSGASAGTIIEDNQIISPGKIL